MRQLQSIVVRAAFLTTTLFAISVTAHADPNEACSDAEAFALAQDIIKDETAYAQSMQREFVNPLIGMGAPPDYTPTKLANDLRDKGADKLIDEFMERLRQGYLQKNQDPTNDIPSFRKLLATFFSTEHIKARFDLLNRYLLIEQPGIAVNYDPGIQRIVCQFTYRLNFDAMQAFTEKNSVNSADRDLIARANSFQKATGSVFTRRYFIQPDGKGGSTIGVFQK